VLDAARQIALGNPSAGFTLARLASTVVLRRWRGWTLPLQRLLSRGHERSPDVPPAGYRQENMANLPAAVACSLMESLPENLRARRARVEAYRRLLADQAGVELIHHRPGSACLTQVMRVLPQRRGDDGAARMIESLGQGGYEVQGSYLPIHLLGQFSACVWDRLPRTEKVWADLVELPCEPTVSMGDVERIAMIIKGCIGS
jgi:dTDP-4-amino-4,6-dideoxygalactose transaminase